MGQVSPWLALVMQQVDVVWCPEHLEPYRAQWPLGSPTATLYLVEASALRLGMAEGYGLLAKLVEVAPLCCWIEQSTLRGIYGKTVPL